MQSPTTGRMVRRDQFKVLPMPASVIAAINDLASKDGRTIRVGSTGQYPLITPYSGSSPPDYISPSYTQTQLEIAAHDDREQDGVGVGAGGNLADDEGMDHPPPEDTEYPSCASQFQLCRDVL